MPLNGGDDRALLKEIEPSYKPLHPRPAYLIVSGVPGELNVMAASWVMPVSEEPLRLALALDRETKTFELIEKYGEFTVNIVDAKLVDKVYKAGTLSGKEVKDKLVLIGLKITPSIKIKTPGIEEALGIIEAKVWKSIDVGEVRLYIADILAIRVKPEYYNEKYGWDMRKTQILLHLIGRAFTVPGRLILAERK